MTIKIGDMIPEIKFCFREGDSRPESGTCPIGGRFVERTTHDLFLNKRVIIFSSWCFHTNMFNLSATRF